MGEQQPDVVVLAATVGGIEANRSRPADFLLKPPDRNPGHRSGLAGQVRRLLFLGSSCIYPKFSEQPIREESLLTGPLNQLMLGTPSPRSPGSSCARPFAYSTGLMQSASCPPISMGLRQLPPKRQPRTASNDPPLPRSHRTQQSLCSVGARAHL